MGASWTRFAATGDPNPSRHGRKALFFDRHRDDDDDDEDDDNVDGTVRWPRFRYAGGREHGSHKQIVFADPIRVEHQQRSANCGFWQPYLLARSRVPSRSDAVTQRSSGRTRPCPV